MTPNEQKAAARKFVERWKAAEGNEQRESNKFWIELCGEVLGIPNPTHLLDFERKVKGKRIDVFYEDMGILIENKSRGIDMDMPEQRGKDRYGNKRMVTPFEQAKWYADNITPKSVTPKWIVTCNFDAIRIYDMDREDAETSFETLTLDELPNMVHRLSFFTREENSRLEREKQLSVAAGEVVGKLYDAFAKAYIDIENNADEQRSLNMLITRIVFLLYAEDADLLQERNAFYNYLKNFQVTHMRQALIDLFAVLKTPEDERDPYLAEELSAFPYVNGGLFKDDVIIPQFDQDTRFLLLQEASAEFDWAGISPTIFGAVFESTLNPETRRAGGMHYTSIENIHKLTGPLFYDALKDELTTIEGLKTEKERKFKLNAFRKKIASIKILDPACGSGNFLTETYLSLRKLENRVLEDLYGGQMVMGLVDPIQVSLGQFYGIEINDFAVEVAKTALWIAELQMLDETREILDMWIDALPLKSNDNIHEGNALRMDWNEVLPAVECSYLIGNPPFVGARQQTPEQKQDMNEVFNGSKGCGNLDYVAGWYEKSSSYIADYGIGAAFVSTNSICQGEQPALLWRRMFNKGFRINFAHDTFRWVSEASHNAHVFVVIVGFSKADLGATLYHYPNVDAVPERLEASNLNAYLMDAPSVFIDNASAPISDGVKPINYGSFALDDGNYTISNAEYEEILSKDPGMRPYLKPFVGANEIIRGAARWCLWLDGCTTEEVQAHPIAAEKVERVRSWRASSSRKNTFELAKTPMRFAEIRQPEVRYLAIPTVSGEKRFYMPMCFLDADVIASNQIYVLPGADLYDFGVLASHTHNSWMRVVGGRLKSDYRYAAAVVYNTFPWPSPDEGQRNEITRCAQKVLDMRERHQGKTLAQMYDGISPLPDNPSASDQKKYAQHEYDDLRDAHKELDAAVEAAYGTDFNGDEEKIVGHLFKLYAEMTEEK